MIQDVMGAQAISLARPIPTMLWSGARRGALRPAVYQLRSGRGTLDLLSPKRRAREWQRLRCFSSEAITDAKASPHPKEPMKDLFNQTRLAMRTVPYALTVISAHPPAPASPHGLLVSSFNTLTMQPQPLVSFNLALPSRTYDAIAASDGIFSVSPLTSVSAAKWFAGQYSISPRQPSRIRQDMDQKDGAKHNHGLNLPTSKEEEFGGFLQQGRAWRMECKWIMDKCMEVGDHIVIVAKVVGIEAGGVEGAGRNKVLVYQDGHVKDVGERAVERAEVDD